MSKEPNWDKMEARLVELPDDASDEQLADVVESWRDEKPNDSQWVEAWGKVLSWLRSGNEQSS